MYISRHPHTVHVCVFTFLLSIASACDALDRYYDPSITTCSDQITDPNCWIGGTIPGIADNAIFDNAATTPYTVNFSTSVSNDGATVRRDMLAWNLGSNAYNFANDLVVGLSAGDVADLTIINGSVTSQNSYIGNAGSIGTVTVDGIGSAWTTNNNLVVGNTGSGAVTITNGGIMNTSRTVIGINHSDAQLGTVTVEGPGSTWTNLYTIDVGNDGRGDLNILNGGAVYAKDTRLGVFAGGGFVNVDGAATSLVNSGSLIVGEAKSSILNITNGAHVSSLVATVGDNGSGFVTVDGIDSRLDVGNELIIGRAGSGDWGQMNIINGGVVTSSSGRVGISQAVGVGIVNIDGANSAWINSGELTVGESGSGTMNILSGGVVSDTTGYISRFMPSSYSARHSYVTVDGVGSSWNNSDSLYVGGDGVAEGGAASLAVSNGGSVNAASLLKVWHTSVISLTDGSIRTDTVINDGSINIGSGGAGDSDLTAISEYVGYDGNGILNQNGGTHSIGSLLILGYNSTANGIYNLNDGTLNANTGIGWRGTGVFNQSGGAINGSVTINNMSTYNLTGGYVTSPTVIAIDESSTMNQSGGVATITPSLHRGLALYGTYNLNGGLLDTFRAEITSLSGAVFEQTGGAHNVGTLLLSNHDPIASTQTTTGEYNLRGGNLASSFTLLGNTINMIGAFNQTGGTHVSDTLEIRSSSGTYNLSGGRLDATNIYVNNGGNFNFDGGTLLVDNYSGNLVNKGGTIEPGASPGITNIFGDYTQSIFGTYIAEIAGLTQGSEYDLLNVTGTATLGGILDVNLLNTSSFTPSLGDTFDILMADTISGEFDILLLASISGGLGWDVSYILDPFSTDIVRLTIIQAVPVPPALWLFGSGLLGLIGISRKKTK